MTEADVIALWPKAATTTFYLNAPMPHHLKLYVCEVAGATYYVASDTSDNCYSLIAEIEDSDLGKKSLLERLAEPGFEYDVKEVEADKLLTMTYRDDSGNPEASLAQALADTDTPAVIACSEW